MNASTALCKFMYDALGFDIFNYMSNATTSAGSPSCSMRPQLNTTTRSAMSKASSCRAAMLVPYTAGVWQNVHDHGALSVRPMLGHSGKLMANACEQQLGGCTRCCQHSRRAVDCNRGRLWLNTWLTTGSLVLPPE